jgi:hypothetical protein
MVSHISIPILSRPSDRFSILSNLRALRLLLSGDLWTILATVYAAACAKEEPFQESKASRGTFEFSFDTVKVHCAVRRISELERTAEKPRRPLAQPTPSLYTASEDQNSNFPMRNRTSRRLKLDA